jgi:adenylyltransferase/sulfurtransferase
MLEPRLAAHRIPGHALVVGAGGIGCPAGWGLVAAGVERITLIDPDVVALSNLPRQVLYAESDVGQTKAPLAAARLDAWGSEVRGLHARLSHENANELLGSADVVIDATDGATTKDWLNAACVRLAVPLVHAAGLRSEGRLLVVPPGGEPCLTCLFGRLRGDLGSCADHGVWNGVVGIVGFLAAHHAVMLLLREARPSAYQVLDFDTGRSVSLGASPDPRCPVCGNDAERIDELLPEADVCAVPGTGGAAPPSATVDLREERCPMNLLRARRALEDAEAGSEVEFLLGAEGAETVPDGVRGLGHRVLAEEPVGAGLRLLVEAGTAHATERLDESQLQQFARQVVLPGVGEQGQARLAEGHLCVLGTGLAADAAARYLEAAGLGGVARAPDASAGSAVGVEIAGGIDPLTVRRLPQGMGIQRGFGSVRDGLEAHPPAVQLALGALLADRAQRTLVMRAIPPRTFCLTSYGTVADAELT